MKKLITATFVALTLLSAGARAQTTAAAPAALSTQAAPDPATAAAVRELLDSMNYRAMMNGAMQSMTRNMPNMILQMATNSINANTNLSDEERKVALAKAAERIPGAIAGMQTLLSDPTLIDAMIDEIVPLYARHFTVDEIHQMAAFYKTPVGAKMLNEMPQLMTEAMQIGQRVVMPRLAKQMETVTKVAAPVQ